MITPFPSFDQRPLVCAFRWTLRRLRQQHDHACQRRQLCSLHVSGLVLSLALATRPPMLLH